MSDHTWSPPCGLPWRQQLGALAGADAWWSLAHAPVAGASGSQIRFCSEVEGRIKPLLPTEMRQRATAREDLVLAAHSLPVLGDGQLSNKLLEAVTGVQPVRTRVVARDHTCVGALGVQLLDARARGEAGGMFTDVNLGGFPVLPTKAELQPDLFTDVASWANVSPESLPRLALTNVNTGKTSLPLWRHLGILLRLTRGFPAYSWSPSAEAEFAPENYLSLDGVLAQRLASLTREDCAQDDALVAAAWPLLEGKSHWVDIVAGAKLNETLAAIAALSLSFARQSRMQVVYLGPTPTEFGPQVPYKPDTHDLRADCPVYLGLDFSAGARARAEWIGAELVKPVKRAGVQWLKGTDFQCPDWTDSNLVSYLCHSNIILLVHGPAMRSQLLAPNLQRSVRSIAPDALHLLTLFRSVVRKSTLYLNNLPRVICVW